ncbi:MAG: hypothetical protein ACK5RL_08850 [Acidimicrobiales bacterium]
MSWFTLTADRHRPGPAVVDVGLVGSPGTMLVGPSLAELEDRIAPSPDQAATTTCFATSIEPPGPDLTPSIGRRAVVRAATPVNPAAMDGIIRAIGAETWVQEARSSPSPLLDRWPPSDRSVDHWRTTPMVWPRDLPPWVGHLTGIRVSWRRSTAVVRALDAVAIDVADRPDAPALLRIDPGDPAALMTALTIVERIHPHRIRLDAVDLAGLDDATTSDVVAACTAAGRSRVVELVGEIGSLDPWTQRAAMVGAARAGGILATSLVVAVAPGPSEIEELTSLVELDPTTSVTADAVSLAAIDRHRRSRSVVAA